MLKGHTHSEAGPNIYNIYIGNIHMLLNIIAGIVLGEQTENSEKTYYRRWFSGLTHSIIRER